jgi:hypothetical protein
MRRQRAIKNTYDQEEARAEQNSHAKEEKTTEGERHWHDGRLTGVAANCSCFCRGPVGSYLDVDLKPVRRAELQSLSNNTDARSLAL